MYNSTSDAARERQQQILGPAPRIGPSTSDTVIDAAVELTRNVRRAAGSTTPVDRDSVPELMATMMRHPDLFKAVGDLSIQLLGHGALAKRERQLAILRVTWLCGAPYAFGEHVTHCKRIGMTSEEIERVTAGSGAPGWSELERAILRAVEELHETAAISDATWAVLARHWDERQLIELPILVGQFTQVAYSQNALRLRLAPGNAGLMAR